MLSAHEDQQESQRRDAYATFRIAQDEMTVTKVYYKHRNLTFRVHEANKKLRDNYVRQQAMIRAQNKRQIMDEKAAFIARMNHLHPAAKQAFLRMRLAAVEDQLKKNDE